MKRQLEQWARLRAEGSACRWFGRLAGAVFIAGFLPGGLNAATDPTQHDLERRFDGTVRPFVETYCITCHGKEKPKADFDLSPYATMVAVVRDHEHWELALDKP